MAAGGLWSTFSQGKFFVYYLPLLPVAALAGALLASTLLARLGRARPLAGVVLATLLFLLAGFPGRFGRLIGILSGRESVRAYWVSDLHNMGSDFSLQDNIELADYLRQTTTATDRVFIWGSEPAVNFLARHGTLTRFIYNLPMLVDYAPQRFRTEFLRVYARPCRGLRG